LQPSLDIVKKKITGGILVPFKPEYTLYFENHLVLPKPQDPDLSLTRFRNL